MKHFYQANDIACRNLLLSSATGHTVKTGAVPFSLRNGSIYVPSSMGLKNKEVIFK